LSLPVCWRRLLLLLLLLLADDGAHDAATPMPDADAHIRCPIPPRSPKMPMQLRKENEKKKKKRKNAISQAG